MEDNGSKGKYFELAKNTGVLAIGNFSSKILVFFLVPLYTNYLTTSEYGYYDLAYTTIQLLVPILSLNVTDGVLRFLLENKKNIGAINRVSLKYIISSIIAVGVGLVVCYLVKVPHVSDEYILLLLLYYTSYMFNQYMIQFSKGVDKVKDMAVAGVIGTLFMVLSCLIFLPLLNLGLFGFFISNICGQAMPALYLIIKLRPFSYKANISEDYRSFENRYLSYTLPLIMANIGWWINNTSDRYIITWLEGVEVNGLLSVAYKLPSVLNVVYGLFIQAWQISAMKEYGKKGSTKFYSTVFIHLNVAMCLLGSGLIILTKVLSKLMFAKTFYSAWQFVPFLTLSSVFTATAGYIAPILTSSYDTNSVARSTLYGGITNIMLNVVLTIMIGAQGVAVATAISSFTIMLFRFLALKKPRVISENVFHKSLVMWGTMVVQATGMLFDNYWIQLICIIVVFFVSYETCSSIIRIAIRYLHKRVNN